MALKPDRVEHLTDISFYKNDAVAERGVVVAHSTGGSGAAMDDSLAQVRDYAAYKDEPAGLLMNDVVNIDLTRQKYNQHQDEVQLGSKVTLLRIGTVVTNQYSGTPVVGERAFVGLDGKLQTESQYLGPKTGPWAGGSGVSLPSGTAVGRFLGVANSDGYVKVAINIV
jgi:hypothetical protein|tara:strand:- start:2737 stop:3240 length:504 start_codon:yes stop_codon:yes gene_type:complete